MDRSAYDPSMNEHPIRLIVNDDLQRTRLTVFFRWILAIPHFFVLMLYGIAAYFVLIVNWFATLFGGRSPDGLHNFLAGFLRYATHVAAYQNLLADPLPPFGGGEAYPVDLEIARPEAQSRLTVFFRAIMSIPAFILNYVLNAVLSIIAFLGWFVCLFAGQMPEGMRNLGAYCLRYQQQTMAYYMLLTPRYPSLSAGMVQGTPAASGGI
jgi:hypothetical protein